MKILIVRLTEQGPDEGTIEITVVQKFFIILIG